MRFVIQYWWPTYGTDISFLELKFALCALRIGSTISSKWACHTTGVSMGYGNLMAVFCLYIYNVYIGI